MSRSRRRIARRLVGLAALALAALLALPIPPILALRWIDPPTSAFMLRHRFAPAGRDRLQGERVVDYRWTDLGDIAPAMALAVVAAEDQHFPHHHGLDVQSISEAYGERHRRRRARGASTITQQVAKNLFLWPGRTYARKGVEAYLALLIELCWPKSRVLEVYLNVAEMGNGIYGAGAAAERYFDTRAGALTRRQAALMAAALPSPRRSRPDRPSPWLEERARWIERQIDQLGGATYLAGILPAGEP